MTLGAVVKIFVKKEWTYAKDLQRYQYARDKFKKETG